MQTNDKERGSNIICGRNPVLEAVRSGREIDRLLIAHGISGGSVTAIIAKCKAKGVLIKEISPQKLDYYCGGANHQGVAVMLASQEYSSVDDILALADERNEKPFIIICDGLEDPHNLGAVIRTAEATGVHGVIIPERRSASLNATVAKAACGALEYVPVARVTNIASTIDRLKENGIWVFGADMDGEDYTKTDFDVPCAIVIGNEGKGIGTLTAKKCDKIISLPMLGKINSLNASVAAGILMYETVRKRRHI
ncbi:MAG: 23S rRNA (guanosine(2251)-2'-O)-methyltransferase RlmB [Acutalibacteraceae bacterium]|nr:23S rRNA (guanosine(2251)-2'-O)-methyltransferase RlmB [Clostridia bacterium]MEE1330130.1 23S rRNA (guanosine(2251)-2'-O)-methyltransferase RlmB [Acutalibacteraceae bacterium]